MADVTSEPDPVEETRMTLGEHLEELRVRLIRSVIAIGIAFVICWTYHKPLGEWTRMPYNRAATWLNADLTEMATEAIATSDDPEEFAEWYERAGYPEIKELRDDLKVPERMKGDAASQGFFFIMKMCFYYSLFFGGPLLIWELWQFIAAGLYKNEKTVVHAYFPISVGLFVGGVLFGYFVMVPQALYFLARMTLTEIQYFESIGNYWTFLVSLTIALGVVFQLPLLMVAAAKLDLVPPKTFGKYRGHMVIGALLVSAMITPPDPFTQMMMAIPIVVLYELGIWSGHFVTRNAPPTDLTPAE